MTMTFSERADQLCDALREIEHQAEEGDELFYCAYLLGLLGLHSSAEGEGQAEFDEAFEGTLRDTLEAENVSEADQTLILNLWHKTRETV
ncbi:YfcL family protein [Marinomonas spartinae]|uniref:YfcL family protein n=1 Tax=Marinomonas spartinae TaxID=1792290 RepID=UPI0018F13D71|nr:YfcL family protein [Marinomonas spartinae]MBJ7556743.1 YfcL family protein [Marinomonas spartinae]